MNSFEIKVIAMITMVIDHVGAFFFPDLAIFRIIGRLSFPLFAFLIANGAHYTKDINKYIGRIFLFALISQIPYHLAFNLIIPDFVDLNVLFTFFLALVAIALIQKTNNIILSALAIFSTAAAAFFFKTDYGLYGVLLTISFYLYFKDLKAISMSFIVLALFAAFEPVVNEGVIVISTISWGPLISTFSLSFISAYNYKDGLKTKYLFYIFYPLHLVIIYFIYIFNQS